MGMPEILIDLHWRTRRVERRRVLVFRVVMSGVLAVAVMLGLLVVVSVDITGRGCIKPRRMRAQWGVEWLARAVVHYELKEKACPRDLEALVEAQFEIVDDPWGRPYSFACERDWQRVRVQVCSQGAAVDDPADDVCVVEAL